MIFGVLYSIYTNFMPSGVRFFISGYKMGIRGHEWLALDTSQSLNQLGIGLLALRLERYGSEMQSGKGIKESREQLIWVVGRLPLFGLRPTASSMILPTPDSSKMRRKSFSFCFSSDGMSEQRKR